MMTKIILIFLLFITGDYALDKKDCKCRILTQKKVPKHKFSSHHLYPFSATIIYNDLKSISEEPYQKLIPDSYKINRHQCQGIIINEDTILTSMNCITLHLNNSYSITFGSSDLIELNDKKKYEIEKEIINPNLNVWHSKFTIDDFAVIKLKDKIQFNRQIQPACLFLKDSKDYSKGILNTIGYRISKIQKQSNEHISKSINQTRYLREIDLEMITKEELEKNKDSSTYATVLNDNDSLLALRSKRKNHEIICEGGNPLFYTLNGRTSVIGLLSFPNLKHKHDNETDDINLLWNSMMFNRISKSLDFIKENIGDYCELDYNQ